MCAPAIAAAEPYLCFWAHLRTRVLAAAEERSAIRTGGILGSLAGLAGRAQGDSQGRGQEGPLAAVHRGGTGQWGPDQGTAEDYRSSCGMQSLSCKRGKQTGQLVGFCLLIHEHMSSISYCSPEGPTLCEKQTSNYLVKQQIYFQPYPRGRDGVEVTSLRDTSLAEQE